MSSSKSPSPVPMVSTAMAFGKDDPDDEDSKRSWFSKIKLEPMMLFHMIGVTSLMVNVQNFYIERICAVTLNISPEICRNLTAYKEQETQVEAIAAEYTVYKQLIEAGFPVIFALFVGPWSDKYGTRTPMLLSISGFLISTLMLMMFSADPTLPPWILLFSSVPIALTGGMITVIMTVFSYIASTTTEKNRSYRIAMLEGAWWMGSPIGLIGGAEINKYCGITVLFLCASLAYLMSLIFGMVFMDNDRKKPKSPRDPYEFCVELFNFQSVRELLVTCCRQRSGNRRGWIFVLVLALNLRLFSLFGVWSIMYLFTRNQLGWNYENYSMFGAVDSILGVIGMYSMILIMLKCLKLSDPMMGLVGSLAYAASNLILVVANSSALVYIAAIVQIPSTLLSTSIRSLLSKCVSKKELGKIFSFLSIGEAIVPLIASPVYSMVFKRTITTFPGAVFLISVGVSCIVVMLFFYLLMSMAGFKSHEEFDQDQPSVHFRQRMEEETNSESVNETESEDDTGLHMQMQGSRFDRIEIISLTA